jgi:molybdate transport system regulatory protein
MGLAKGSFVCAEVKAPMVFVVSSESEFKCSADNKFKGIVKKISKGRVACELVVKISESIEICSILSSEKEFLFSVNEGNEVFVFFNCFAVVLNVD